MPSDWGVPLVVMSLLLATVISAALAGRYQAHHRRLWTSAKRLEGAAGGIARSLNELAQVPLSREFRTAMRSEVLACYQRIRRQQRRYPQIARQIQQAEQALQGEAERSVGSLGPIDSAATFRRIMGSLDYLIEMIENGAFLQPMPRDVRIIFRRQLGERRAEVLTKYHLLQSKRLTDAGDIASARGHLMALLRALRQQMPQTDFVRALYAEAEAASHAMQGRPQGRETDSENANAA